MAKRLKAMGNSRYEDAFELTLHEDLIDLPRSMRRPRTVFVNSMSDLFHERVPIGFIQRIFSTMVACPQHTFQVLTKRSQRAAELAKELPWPPNVWMGASVEDERALFRADQLREIPAYVRFLSCEPLLGPLSRLNLKGISWVIVGGESGPGARAMKPVWVESIRHQCILENVHFFFKQWGGVQKSRTGRILNGRTYDEMPPRLRATGNDTLTLPVIDRQVTRVAGDR